MRNIIRLAETDSTNKYIRTVADKNACVIADRQSAGRGRLGRAFLSPEGGLYMSFKCHSTDTVGDALTAKAAVALSHAVERLTGISTEIKWVNDIYTNGKKLCGILAEGVWTGGELDCIIIGIGVNLRGELPEEIRGIATSVEEAGGTVPEKEALAEAILDEFDSLTDFYSEYKARQFLLGKAVKVHRGDEVFCATAQDLDDDCAMVLRLPNGETVSVTSGEVSLREE